jgi:hypothetical protein
VPPPPVDGAGPLLGVVGATVGVPVGVPTVGTVVVPPLPVSESDGAEASSPFAQATLTRKVDAIVAVRRAFEFVIVFALGWRPYEAADRDHARAVPAERARTRATRYAFDLASPTKRDMAELALGSLGSHSECDCDRRALCAEKNRAASRLHTTGVG